MFAGFTVTDIDVGEVRLHTRYAGDGPPILLLHGHPRTGATWHRVAPLLLSAGYSVVCPDLRGYGASSKPATTPDHAPYSKRAMATDMSTLMRQLGHSEYAVAGHDRGSYVALRLALDQFDEVTRLAVLDSIPIVEHLERCDDRFATAWWHWFFFAQPDKPEQAINADPDAWYNAARARDLMGDEAFAEYSRAIHDPKTVRAMLEDYRAGLGIDRRHTEEDRSAGRVVRCPTLMMWSTRDDLEELYGNPLEIWRDWSVDLRGFGINSGHHMAEEAPDELAGALISFFR